MLINFSSVLTPMPKTFITADETEISVQCEKMDKEYKLYGGKYDATVCKSTILQSTVSDDAKF